MTSFQKTNKHAPGQAVEKGIKFKARNVMSETVFADGIICLIDGKKKRNLGKWLVLQYGMTPAEYRRMYNLPNDYPMKVEQRLPTPGKRVIAFTKPKLIASPQVA